MIKNLINKRKAMICFLFIVPFLPYLFLEEILVPDVVYLSGLLIVISAIIIFKMDYCIKNEEGRRKKSIIHITALGLTLIFALSLSIIRLFASQLCDFDFLSEYFHSKLASFAVVFWTCFVYIPIVLISIYIIVLFLINTVLGLNIFSKYIHKNNGEANVKNFIICFGILFFISIAFLFSTYPGIWLNDDVMTVQLLALSKTWHHWHTLGYLLFVRLLIAHAFNTFPVNVVQTLIWIFIQFYILYGLKKNKKCMFFYTFLSALIFTPYNYLEVMIKDTVYAMGILCITAVIFFIITNKKITVLDFVAGIIGVLMSSLFRHGGVFVIGASLTILFLYFLINNEKQQKLIFSIILLVISILSYCIINITISDYIKAEKNPSYIKYSTPLQMISAAAHENFEFTDEELKEIEEFIPIEAWSALYNPYWSDSIAREWGNPSIDELSTLIETENYGKKLISLNAKIFVRNPILYLKALAKIDSIIVEVATPNDAYDIKVGCICDAPRKDFIYYSGLYNITDSVSRITNEIKVLIPFYWRGGFYFCGAIFSIVCYILVKKKKNIIVLFPAILNTGLLLLACPAQDPRYILPIMEVMIFIFATLPFYSS